MKRKMLALIGAVTILGATSYAVEPYEFGIKLGGINFMVSGLDKAKNAVGGANESSIFNPSGIGLLYGEYAFHENVGGALEAGYFYGRTATLKTKSTGKDIYKIDLHGVKVLPIVKFYPMGREDENGILQLYVGGDFTIPVGGKGQKNNEEPVIDIKSDDLTTFGLGAMAGVGYEFPFGLLLDLRGGYTFTDVFKEDSKFKKDKLGIADPKKDGTNAMHFGLSVGYNFAKLLEE